MSLRNRGGNIGKIKYFLPVRKNTQQDDTENSQPNYNRKGTSISYVDSDVKPQRKQPSWKPSSENKDMKGRMSADRSAERKPSRQQPLLQSRQTIHQVSKHQQSIDVDIVGIKDVSTVEQKRSIYDMFPEESEKQEFFDFLQKLKNDQEYQNSITMFTIMYYYQKKAEKKKK